METGTVAVPRPRWLSSLTWSAIGGVGAAAILLCAHTVSGRLLGPADYGSAMFVLAVGQAGALVLALGLDVALFRWLPRVTTPELRANVLASSALVVAATSGVAIMVGLASSLVLSDATLREPVAAIAAAFLLAGVLTMRSTADRILSGVEEFRRQAWIRIGETAVVLAVAVLLAVTWSSAAALVVAIGAGYAAYVVATAGTFRRLAAGGQRSRASLVPLRSWAAIALLHAVTPIGFAYGDKIALRSFAGPAELGLYSVYFAATFTLVGQALAVVTNVLFPHAARTEDMAGLVRRVLRVVSISFLPVGAVLMCAIWVFCVLYGGEFPFTVTTAMLASAWGALLFANGLISVLTVTHSTSSYLMTALLQGVRSLVFMVLVVVVGVMGRLDATTCFASLVAIEVLDSVNLWMIIRSRVLQEPVRDRAGEASGRVGGSPP